MAETGSGSGLDAPPFTELRSVGEEALQLSAIRGMDGKNSNEAEPRALISLQGLTKRTNCSIVQGFGWDGCRLTPLGPALGLVRSEDKTSRAADPFLRLVFEKI